METIDILHSGKQTFNSAIQMPDLNFKHINNLTDLTGIMQHSTLPNRKEGYSIDDNSRALLLTVWACKDKKNSIAARLLPIYLSFVQYMQTDDGHFKNFMSDTKVGHKERCPEDSFGRTMMALGYLINDSRSSLPVKTGREIFTKAYPHVQKLVSLRGMANAIIGICQHIKCDYPDDLKRNMVIRLSDKMASMYKENKINSWHWFEPELTYDNAMLPLALLNAYEVTQEEEYLTIAFESMHFLESKVFHNDVLSPIGNKGWCKENGSTAQFDQQGIDVMAMILYYQQAFRLTREQQYLDSMYKSHQWFFGNNDLGLPLYDATTGGCADGLHRKGVNLNQGAESTLAYWISHLVVTEALTE
ncbi:glycosyltransferase [Niastella koreensis]|uniref:Group 1 glycosyl transferase n=2 Tax=Niastella koreensis TaxID=354356 RepID=G8T883_NIAKG|nr:group 1 glycosyl transferase [Niastella koreensis]AEV98034.1 group 1 glycosyl transferase [Niastella koreensis GR20-10]OQP40168.1 glycosyltransferase [Niastella koreensis]